MILDLPVRFTGISDTLHEYAVLRLEVAKTAFLLVDCESSGPPDSPVGQVLRQTIAPTLAAIRSLGMKAVFLYGGDHHDPPRRQLCAHPPEELE